MMKLFPHAIALLLFTAISYTTSASAAADKFRVIIVADTDDFSAGQAIKIGRDRAVAAFNGIASKLRANGLNTSVAVFDSTAFDQVKVVDAVTRTAAAVGQNDTVIFYYIGHGKNMPGRDFPFLLLPSDKKDGIFLDNIADIIDASHPRLSVVIAEACNAFSSSAVTSGSLADNSNSVLSDIKLDDAMIQLFDLSGGAIVLASSSPGEYAGADLSKGPFFTFRFFNILTDYLQKSTASKKFASWRELLRRAIVPITFKDWAQKPVFNVDNLRENTIGNGQETSKSQVSATQNPDQELPVTTKQGLADRRDWELWVSSLQSDKRLGAEYWASQRSVPNPGSCIDPALQMSAMWVQGCSEAKIHLDPMDERRRHEALYREGWNSY